MKKRTASLYFGYGGRNFLIDVAELVSQPAQKELELDAFCCALESAAEFYRQEWKNAKPADLANPSALTAKSQTPPDSTLYELGPWPKYFFLWGPIQEL